MKEKPLQVGLRERNKIEKLRRIKGAARRLFLSRGFDNTTTREVARAADVGLGTLFAYAENKRDLLFLIVNDDLDAVIAQSATLIDDDASFIDNLTTVIRTHYEYFGKQPKLSVLLMRELQLYDTGEQAERFNAVIKRVVGLIGTMIELGQRRGQIRLDEDPLFAAAIVFSIIRAQLRHWLGAGKLDIRDAISDLRRAVRLLISGLAPLARPAQAADLAGQRRKRLAMDKLG